jgi:hypothetical protein
MVKEITGVRDIFERLYILSVGLFIKPRLTSELPRRFLILSICIKPYGNKNNPQSGPVYQLK